MNAPLPEHIRKALETVTLDDKLRSELQRSYKYETASEAGRTGFGVEQIDKRAKA